MFQRASLAERRRYGGIQAVAREVNVDLTPEEKRELERLQAKLGQASIAYTASRPDKVAYLRDFIEQVEAGTVTDFIVVGLGPDGAKLSVTFAVHPEKVKPSFAMVGALDTVRAMLVKAILPKE